MAPSVEDESFTLEGQLCFALYDASHAMTARYRAGLAALGLTYSQYVVMLLLWERDRMTLGELAGEVGLDRATLSPMLKRMEQQQLLARSRDAEDERVLEVICTEEGRRLREPARRVARQVEEVCGLSPSELARLREELRVLAQNLRSDDTAHPSAG